MQIIQRNSEPGTSCMGKRQFERKPYRAFELFEGIYERRLSIDMMQAKRLFNSSSAQDSDKVSLVISHS
jgi:hypothetical protein